MSKKIVVSKFNLMFTDEDHVQEYRVSFTGVRGIRVLSPLFRMLRLSAETDAIFVSNPKFSEMFLCWLVKRATGRKIKIFYFDLILRRPDTLIDKFVARIKAILLGAVDTLIVIHQDLSGYQKWYAVDPKKCHYVAFKANNFDLIDEVGVSDQGYVVALGGSHRDYATLVEAVRGTSIQLFVIVPSVSMALHRSVFRTDLLPPNVTHISTHQDRKQWNEWIAGASLVVVPILPETLQPAGISVCLEAMAFGKPVVVTQGASTVGTPVEHIAAVVPAANVLSMRETIQALMADSERRADMGQRGKQYASSLGDHARLVRDLRQVVLGAI